MPQTSQRLSERVLILIWGSLTSWFVTSEPVAVSQLPLDKPLLQASFSALWYTRRTLIPDGAYLCPEKGDLFLFCLSVAQDIIGLIVGSQTYRLQHSHLPFRHEGQGEGVKCVVCKDQKH